MKHIIVDITSNLQSLVNIIEQHIGTLFLK